METGNTLFSCPILLFRRTNTFLDLFVVNSVQWTRLAFQCWLVVVSIRWTLYAFVSRKKRILFRAWNTLLYLDVINLFIGAILACFVRKVEEFRVETCDTFFSSEVLFLWRTFALFWLLIVNLFEWTVGAILNGNVKVCIIARTCRTSLVHQYWEILWTSGTLIYVNVVYIIFGTWLTFLSRVIKVVWEVTGNTSFWCLVWKELGAFTFLRFWVELFVKRTFVACFVHVVEKVRNWTWNAFGVSFEWGLWLTDTFLTGDIVERFWLACLTV